MRNMVLVGGASLLIALFISVLDNAPSATKPSAAPVRTTPTVRVATPSPSPALEVLPGLAWEQTSSQHVTVKGEVRNLTADSLRGVIAVVTFRTKDGVFITNAESVIDFNPLLPGQASPFDVIERYNPAMDTFSLRFRLPGGKQLITLNAP